MNLRERAETLEKVLLFLLLLMGSEGLSCFRSELDLRNPTGDTGSATLGQKHQVSDTVSETTGQRHQVRDTRLATPGNKHWVRNTGLATLGQRH